MNQNTFEALPATEKTKLGEKMSGVVNGMMEPLFEKINIQFDEIQALKSAKLELQQEVVRLKNIIEQSNP